MSEEQDWKSPPGGGFLSLPTRRRSLTSIPHEGSRKEWPLMRNFSTFIQRKGSKAIATATGPPQMSFKSKTKTISKIIPKMNARIIAEEKAAELEKEIEEVRRTAGEEISGLELKVASRDAVLRRRAVHMAETADKIASLEEQLTSAISREADVAAETELLKNILAAKEKQFQMREEELENQRLVEEIEWTAKENHWKKMEKQFHIREEEVEKIIADNRPRPVRGVVKSLVIAGTGAVVALATSGNS